MRMVSVALKEEADIVKCKWYQGNQDAYDIVPKQKSYKVYSNVEAFRTREVNIAIHGKLYHKRLLENQRYPKVTTHDDEYFVYKLIYAAKKIIVLDEIYYYYYMSPNSIMRKKRKRLPLEFVQAYEQRIRFFEDKKEVELANISCKEFAIRLMLVYMKYHQYEECELTQKEIAEYFKQYYKIGKKYAKGLKEKVSLYVFYLYVRWEL